jgi:outer membrane receptor protein involved in Fe transport
MTRLFLIAGIRVDDLRTHSLPPDAFGFRPLVPPSSVVKVNPRISAAYVPREGSRGGWLGATRLHGSFGTGIRAPDGFELAFTNNPRLKPEKSLSFDSGVEQHFFGDRALVDATYFYNRFKDQIVVLGGSLANLSTYISDNLGNTRAEGMELSFRARPTRSLFVSGEYTLLASSILSLEGTSLALAPFHVGQPLIRRPKNSGFLQLAWRHGPLVLSTNAILRGRTLDVEPNNATGSCVLGLPCLFDNKGYARADAGFSYRLPKGLEIYGRLNNFLNRKYEEVLGFPALRLNFLAGLRISLPPE